LGNPDWEIRPTAFSMLLKTWSVIREAGGGLLQLVYPPVCWACLRIRDRLDHGICAPCRQQLTTDPFPTCPHCCSTVGPYVALDNGCSHCRTEAHAFDRSFRMGPYDGALRDSILRMKQRTGEPLAEAVGAMWARHMQPRVAECKPDVVVPVPLHWSRRWRRGFNQSAVLAEALAGALGIPCRPRWLRRVRPTPKQTAQESPAARRDNVRGAFAAGRAATLADKTVLLVDDVMTSVATASEAAKALRPLKPKHIIVAVLAHGK
jgi:ComF family protein